MKKRKKYPKSHSIHKRHHKVKLATLFLSKIILALISFTIGLYMGSLTGNTFIALLVAFAIAIMAYLFSVLHLIDYLKI